MAFQNVSEHCRRSRKQAERRIQAQIGDYARSVDERHAARLLPRQSMTLGRCFSAPRASDKAAERLGDVWQLSLVKATVIGD